MKKSLSRNFTEGNIWRQLILFALPFMASNALQVFYSTIDMMIVGHFVGTPGLEGAHLTVEIPEDTDPIAGRVYSVSAGVGTV